MKTMHMMLFSLSFAVVSCSQLPVKAQVKPDHFRLENFKAEKGNQLDLVHLMCFHKRPTAWTEPKQYLAGEHELWVKASVVHTGVVQDVKEAYALFKVRLDAGKSYMLNRNIKDNQISVWIQQKDTGIKVSDVVVAQLKQPLLVDENLRKTQCRQGSI